MSKKGRQYLEACKEIVKSSVNKREYDNSISLNSEHLEPEIKEGSYEKYQMTLLQTTYLPLPLSRNEEIYYLALRETNAHEANKKLIEHNLRLVIYIAKKFNNTRMDMSDLVSVGTIGLTKAIKTYKLDKNTKLATYASRCITNEIIACLRKNKKGQSVISFDEPVSFDAGGNKLFLKDVMGTDEDVVFNELEDKVEMQIIMTAISQLREQENKIMTLRYGLDGEDIKTQKEVAKVLGMSQSHVSRLEKKIIKQLKSDIHILGY